MINKINLDCTDFSEILASKKIDYTCKKILDDGVVSITEYKYCINDKTHYAYERGSAYAGDAWSTITCIYDKELSQKEIESIEWFDDGTN